jgi:hypothetical protein
MAIASSPATSPRGVGPGMYGSVNTELDLSGEPATGLIFHWAGYVDGEWTIHRCLGVARGI